MSLVLTRLEEGVATLALNNPEKRNAFGQEMIGAIQAALAEFIRERARVLVLRAPSGTKIWSAGYDIAELPADASDPIALVEPIRNLVRAVQDFPAPVIGLIEGGVWGGACEVAMACDILVSTPDATFAITPAKLGIPYNATGLLNYLNAIPLNILKEMVFTAQPIGAARAAALGVVNHLVAAGEIEHTTYEIARKIAANAPLALAAMKEELRMLTSARTLPPDQFERVLTLRRNAFDSADYQEGKKAFHERRAPVFTGA